MRASEQAVSFMNHDPPAKVGRGRRSGRDDAKAVQLDLNTIDMGRRRRVPPLHLVGRSAQTCRGTSLEQGAQWYRTSWLSTSAANQVAREHTILDAQRVAAAPPDTPPKYPPRTVPTRLAPRPPRDRESEGEGVRKAAALSVRYYLPQRSGACIVERAEERGGGVCVPPGRSVRVRGGAKPGHFVSRVTSQLDRMLAAF